MSDRTSADALDDDWPRREFLLTGAGVIATAAGVVAAAPVAAMPGSAATIADGLETGLTYLNNGSVGPSPQPVREAAAAAARQLETNPVHQVYGPLLQQMETARAACATFLGCGTEELAFTRNTTEGMNAIAQGVTLAAGDRILTTDQEHTGGSIGWRYVAERCGAVIDPVPLPADPGSEAQITDLFAAAIRPQTRLISVSQVTYTTGLRLPLPALARLAAAHDLLFVVDGAQSAGIVPLKLSELGCDAFATSGHKWLLGPKGTGLLYIRKSAQARIRPLLLHQGYRSYTGATGTRDAASFIGLGAAVAYLAELGLDRTFAAAMSQRRELQDAVRSLPGVRWLSPTRADAGAPLASLGLPSGLSPSDLASRLYERHRVVVKTLAGAHPGLRISLHCYNSAADIQRLLAALRAELPA